MSHERECVIIVKYDLVDEKSIHIHQSCFKPIIFDQEFVFL